MGKLNHIIILRKVLYHVVVCMSQQCLRSVFKTPRVEAGEAGLLVFVVFVSSENSGTLWPFLLLLHLKVPEVESICVFVILKMDCSFFL